MGLFENGRDARRVWPLLLSTSLAARPQSRVHGAGLVTWPRREGGRDCGEANERLESTAASATATISPMITIFSRL